jgi:hypothetical protein
MAISAGERARMMQAHSIGPKMVAMLERIGVETLDELANADARELAMRIDIANGGRRLNAMGVRALENLIAHAHRSRGGSCRQ